MRSSVVFGLALEVLYIAIGDIVAGHIVGLDVHQLVLHHILYLFHADGAVEALALVGDRCGDLGDLLAAQAELFVPPTGSPWRQPQ